MALPWFYPGAFAAALALTLALGGLAARLPCRRLLAWTCGFFAIRLLALAQAVGIAGLALLSGTGAAAAARTGYRVARSRHLPPKMPPSERPA